MTRFRIGALRWAGWLFLCSPAMAADTGSPDADAAMLAFNNACRTCHTLKEGDNRLGPSLQAIIGRKAGSLPDFAYSSAMKDAGFVWDRDKLDRFIADPGSVVSGNRMKPFGGIAAPDVRARIIAYLESAAGR